MYIWELPIPCLNSHFRGQVHWSQLGSALWASLANLWMHVLKRILTRQSMQRALNSDNSQRKTGIYLKLNLGLKALLAINGLLSWVLSDRGDVVFRNHSTLWGVRRDLLSLLSEFQLMSNMSTTFVPNSLCRSLSKNIKYRSLQRGAAEVRPCRMKYGLPAWPSPVRHALFSSPSPTPGRNVSLR